MYLVQYNKNTFSGGRRNWVTCASFESEVDALKDIVQQKTEYERTFDAPNNLEYRVILDKPAHKRQLEIAKFLKGEQ